MLVWSVRYILNTVWQQFLSQEANALPLETPPKVPVCFREQSKDDVLHCRCATRTCGHATALGTTVVENQITNLCCSVVAGGINVAIGPPPASAVNPKMPGDKSGSSKATAPNTVNCDSTNARRRMILVDTQPLLSPALSVAPEISAGSSGDGSAEDQLRLLALQQLVFLLRVCDTLLVVQDESNGAQIDWEILALLRMAATVHGNCMYVWVQACCGRAGVWFC